MSLFMFSSVRRIWEFFGTIKFLSIFAIEGFFSAMRPHVNLAIFRSRESPITSFMLQNKINWAEKFFLSRI